MGCGCGQAAAAWHPDDGESETTATGEAIPARRRAWSPAGPQAPGYTWNGPDALSEPVAANGPDA